MTTNQSYTSNPAKLVILENGAVHTVDLGMSQQWMLGRYEQGRTGPSLIQLQSPIVSREHGLFRCQGGAWFYMENPANTNGTFYNGVKLNRNTGTAQPSYVQLKDGDILRIDNADLNHASRKGILLLFTTAALDSAWVSFDLTGRTTTVIGRVPGNDIVMPLPYLSARHAQITNRGGQYFLSDCRSKAGTYLNGQCVFTEMPLREKDVITLCDCRFILVADTLIYADRQQAHTNLIQSVPTNRPVILKADIVNKRVKNNNGGGTKELIKDIHLEIRQGTLVALLGTAGAGKSTVMNCLNGMDLEGVSGSVYYRNVNLMQNFDQMKNLIGSVPQQKVFHKTFTPEQEFRFAARKRLPADTTKAEIEQRVDQTLEMLSMTGVRKNRNSKLSGGEQTRVNVGIELVADRDLLCLDEPDQGLSPNYKHELFQIMQNLAHKNGKSVLSIIHDVSEIDMFDQVIMLAKVDGVGRLAFSGTPAEARKFFGTDIKNAYALLEEDPKKFIR